MAYKYPQILTINRKNINEAGATLLTSNLTVYGVLGSYMEIAIGITASENGYDLKPETVFNRTFTFRWKNYTQQGGSIPVPSSSGFRFTTGDAIAAAAPMSFFAANAQSAVMNTNHSATLEVVSSTVIIITFRLYMTSGDENYSPYQVNNINRFHASQNQGNYMELEPGGQFELGSTGISIFTTVSGFPPTNPPSPPTQPYVFVTRGGTGNTLQEFWMPIQMKWPGRNVGNTDYAMYLSEFDVKTRNGDILAAKTHKDTALPHQINYDQNFTETASEVSSFEDNMFRFRFLAGAVASFTITSVRVILVRLDALGNDKFFLLDYDASIASVPASDTTEANISGDIYAPAYFTNGAGFWEVGFRVPGSAFEWGGVYRAHCIMYGTTFSEIYNGISQELIATAFPNFYPKTETFYADYFKESVQPLGIAAYHSGFRARIEILKSSIADAFTYYGLTGDFDTSVQYVRGDIVKPGTENTDTIQVQNGLQQFLWQQGVGLVQGQDFANTTDYLLGAFTGYIDEELLPYASEAEADYYVTVKWEIGTVAQVPVGEPVLLVCQFLQKIVARRWESENGQPTPPPFALQMTLYRDDEETIIAPGSNYVCGAPEVVALVEKIDVLAGGDAFAIPETYAETDTAGNTISASIKQRRPVFNGFLPATTNPAINAYDALFSLNAVMGSTTDDSGARISIQELGTAQRFWFVMLARPDNTDETPFIAVNADIEMTYDGVDTTTVTADFTAWRTAFDALLTGADTLIDFRIKNGVTQNFVGITAGGMGNPSTDPDSMTVTIDHTITPIKVIEVVYEIEGTISGHLVRFMYRGWITLPTTAGTFNETITPGLWKTMDYDY